MALQSYVEPPINDVPLNHSTLFNTMIYSFTRMIIYMVPSGIKVKTRSLFIKNYVFDFIHQGEANTGYNTDKYTCTFSKMIPY